MSGRPSISANRLLPAGVQNGIMQSPRRPSGNVGRGGVACQVPAPNAGHRGVKAVCYPRPHARLPLMHFQFPNLLGWPHGLHISNLVHRWHFLLRATMEISSPQDSRIDPLLVGSHHNLSTSSVRARATNS